MNIYIYILYICVYTYIYISDDMALSKYRLPPNPMGRHHFPSEKVAFFFTGRGETPPKKTAFPSGFPQHQMGGNPGHHPSQ